MHATPQANSSVRPPDDDDRTTVPGAGNINNFPLGILQVPDVTSEGYPKVALFSKVATINRWLSPNPVLFGYEVERVALPTTANAQSAASGVCEPLNSSRLYEVICKSMVPGGGQLRFQDRVVIDARGIGEAGFGEVKVRPPTRPDIQRRRFYEEPSVEGFPRVLTSQQFYSMVACLANPLGPFVGKTVAVAGKGSLLEDRWVRGRNQPGVGV